MAKKIAKPDTGVDESALDGKIQTGNESVAKGSESDLKTPKKQNGAKGINAVIETTLPKNVIKTKKASEAVASGENSSGVAGTLMARGLTFGGGAGVIGDDLSATSRADSSYRSSDRTGKRNDPITRKVDFLPSEIIKVTTRQSKALDETDAKQGYNGAYFNDHAITQRINGGAPAEPLFNRSIDEIGLDMGYYADGQYVTKAGFGELNEYKINNWDPNMNLGNGGYDSPIVAIRGSYLLEDLHVSIDTDGKISEFYFSGTDISARKVDESTSRAASDAALRTINRRELDRNVMVSNAGNESDPSWSPLGEAVSNPSAINLLLADLDASYGDLVFMSTRKLQHALSYQLNKTAKDGMRNVGPMAEMMNGNIEGQFSTAGSSVSESNGRSYCLENAEAYCRGGAGLWLHIHDSLSKYTTKGKLLSMPLSFKSAVATAKANLAPLRAHESFISYVQNSELFSTIDNGYDPLLSVVMTDKASVILPYDIEQSYSLSADKQTVLPMFTMHYENMRNKYNEPVYNDFVYALHRYFKEYASRIRNEVTRISSGPSTWSAYKTSIGQNDNVVRLTIPVQSSTSSISLWDLIVCEIVPYIVESRLSSLTSLLKYERNFGYPYSGIVPLGNVKETDSKNFSFTSTDEPLASSIANPVSALKVTMPEVFWAVKTSRYSNENNRNMVCADVVLPHYFCQTQFEEIPLSIRNLDNTNGLIKGLLLSDTYASMCYPSERSGNGLSFMDTIYGMSEEDYRLALDRMVVYPGYCGTNEGLDTKLAVVRLGVDEFKTNPNYAYKYGMSSDGQPSIPYSVYYVNANDADLVLSIKDVLSTPRELGLSFVMPAGVSTPIIDLSPLNPSYPNYRSLTSSYIALSGPGFTLKTYHSDGTPASAVLGAGSTNISTQASLRNMYDRVQCNPTAVHFDHGFVVNAMALGGTGVTADSIVLNDNRVSFRPFVTGSYTDPNSYNFAQGVYNNSETQVESTALMNVFSFQKYFWTRLQRLPFVINPFDVNAETITYDTAATGKRGNRFDPFDFLYFFGLCGFRSSDYSELINFRSRMRISQGNAYVEDPFLTKRLQLN